MAKIVWSDAASEQLDDIIAYIERFDPVAADDIATGLYALAQSLETFPHRGRPGTNGTRELVTVPPYILRYHVSGEVVTIRSLRHGRRRPQ